MIDLSRRKECCGCSACASVCPCGAIKMKSDALGFMYPEIDSSKCTNCGLCEKVCSFKTLLKEPLDKRKKSSIYGCRMKDMAEVAKSQSGGATTAIADWILQRGGGVYGAVFGKHFSVHHARATNRQERDLQRGSKYVQSNIGTSFKQASEDLKNGLYVLFTGTGCQIAGFLKYLEMTNVDTSRLYTCDLICHGVPSPQLWQDYVNYVETKKLKKQIIKADFRDKNHYGWKGFKETFYTTYTTYTTYMTYTHIFFINIALRPSCGLCPYTSTHRVADFTVCDFWHYEKTMAEMGNDNKGLSLMFVSSSKAAKVFEEIKDNLIFRQVQENDCLQYNMQAPTVLNLKSVEFEKDYIKHGFKYVMKKYGDESLIKKLIKRWGGKVLGPKGKRVVKKLLQRRRANLL